MTYPESDGRYYSLAPTGTEGGAQTLLTVEQALSGLVLSDECVSIQEPAQRYRLGEISGFRKVNPEDMGVEGINMPRAITMVSIKDPYVEIYNAANRWNVQYQETLYNGLATKARESGEWTQRPGKAYIFDAEGTAYGVFATGSKSLTRAFFSEYLHSNALVQWRSLIPTAEALIYLSDPQSVDNVVGRDGTTVPMDKTAKMWLTLCSDARGMRSRATVMSYIGREFAERDIAWSRRLVYWMSAASGTALPTMQAALAAGIADRISFDLVEQDKRSLALVSQIAKDIGFQASKHITKHTETNVFDPRQMCVLKRSLIANNRRPTLVDALGIFEYANSMTGIDPVMFARSLYDMVAPGGRLIIGQMRDDRPNPDFTFGVVGWPFVSMRSVNDILRVIREAEIPLDKTDVYLPQDGVYSVVSIDKPIDAEN
jgi:hypothetical protein